MKKIITTKVFLILFFSLFNIFSLIEYFNNDSVIEYVSYLKIISIVAVFICLTLLLIKKIFNDKWVLKTMVKPEVIKTVNKNEKNYEFLDYEMKQGIAILWEGDAIFATIKGEKKKLTGYIKQLILKDDGIFYFSVAKGEKIEQLAINEPNSKIKITLNGTQYNFKSLCKEVLKLELKRIFKFADHVKKQLSLNEKFSFTFNPPQKMSILLDNKMELCEIEKYCIYHSNYQELLIKSISRQKYTFLPIDNIKSKIQLEDGKKIDIRKWLAYLCNTTDIN